MLLVVRWSDVGEGNRAIYFNKVHLIYFELYNCIKRFCLPEPRAVANLLA
jgi:hypothetical protein